MFLVVLLLWPQQRCVVQWCGPTSLVMVEATETDTTVTASSSTSSSSSINPAAEEDGREETPPHQHQQYQPQQPPPALSRPPLRVAVIGCGPGAMFLLRHLYTARKQLQRDLEGARRSNSNRAVQLQQQQQLARLPQVTIFEYEAHCGGQWATYEGESTTNNITDTTTSSSTSTTKHGIYDGMWINGPKEFFELGDYTFQDHFAARHQKKNTSRSDLPVGIPSYIIRSQVLEYLQGATHDALAYHTAQHQFVFDTEVLQISNYTVLPRAKGELPQQKFKLHTIDADDDETTAEARKEHTIVYDNFDKVVMAGGVDQVKNIPPRYDSSVPDKHETRTQSTLLRDYQGMVVHSSEINELTAERPIPAAAATTAAAGMNEDEVIKEIEEEEEDDYEDDEYDFITSEDDKEASASPSAVDEESAAETEEVTTDQDYDDDDEEDYDDDEDYEDDEYDFITSEDETEASASPSAVEEESAAEEEEVKTDEEDYDDDEEDYDDDDEYDFTFTTLEDENEPVTENTNTNTTVNNPSIYQKRFLLIGSSFSAEDLALSFLKRGAEHIYITTSQHHRYPVTYTKSWPMDKVTILYKTEIKKVLGPHSLVLGRMLQNDTEDAAKDRELYGDKDEDEEGYDDSEESDDEEAEEEDYDDYDSWGDYELHDDTEYTDETSWQNIKGLVVLHNIDAIIFCTGYYHDYSILPKAFQPHYDQFEFCDDVHCYYYVTTMTTQTTNDVQDATSSWLSSRLSSRIPGWMASVTSLLSHFPTTLYNHGKAVLSSFSSVTGTDASISCGYSSSSSSSSSNDSCPAVPSSRIQNDGSGKTPSTTTNILDDDSTIPTTAYHSSVPSTNTNTKTNTKSNTNFVTQRILVRVNPDDFGDHDLLHNHHLIANPSILFLSDHQYGFPLLELDIYSKMIAKVLLGEIASESNSNTKHYDDTPQHEQQEPISIKPNSTEPKYNRTTMEYEYANDNTLKGYTFYRLGMAAMEADHPAQILITEVIVDGNATSCRNNTLAPSSYYDIFVEDKNDSRLTSLTNGTTHCGTSSTGRRRRVWMLSEKGHMFLNMSKDENAARSAMRICCTNETFRDFHYDSFRSIYTGTKSAKFPKLWMDMDDT